MMKSRSEEFIRLLHRGVSALEAMAVTVNALHDRAVVENELKRSLANMFLSQGRTDHDANRWSLPAGHQTSSGHVRVYLPDGRELVFELRLWRWV